MHSTILKVSIIIQFFGLFGIIGAAHYFAIMRSTNMIGIFFLLFWGIPSLCQIMFIIRDLFILPVENWLLKARKFYFMDLWLSEFWKDYFHIQSGIMIN